MKAAGGQQTKPLYEFGHFRLDSVERVLTRDGAPVPLTVKALETLLALVESHGHILEKNELMQRVWPDSFVEENNLAQNISLLRKVLAENGDRATFIETVPKRGYRFVADVKERESGHAELLILEHTKSSVVIEEEEQTGEASTASKKWLLLKQVEAGVV